MRDCLADESAEQREVKLQQMSDSVKEWLLRLSMQVMLSLFHIYPFPSFQPYQSITLPPPETLHYIHLFIQLDSFTICTLVYIIITILFLHLHFTITFQQTSSGSPLNMTCISLVIIGASLSEPHIDELNAEKASKQARKRESSSCV